MKSFLPYILFLLTLQLNAQQTMLLRLHGAQPWEPFHENMQQDLRSKNNKVVAVMGGLNDWDGANNYFNFFGAKVIIEKMDKTSYGSTTMVLRREDGEKFYGLYPIINAEVVPFDSQEFESRNPED
jgi:hypothetical protein